VLAKYFKISLNVINVIQTLKVYFIHYSTKETNNKNNAVLKSTEVKVYSAVVSPVIKVLPDDGPHVGETCCNEK
jgi:hypothetical protein